MALMRLLHDRLEESRDARTVAPLMTFLHDNLRAAEQAAPRKSLACRRGCSHCCHAWVSARAPEVLFVKAAIPAQEREAVRAAVAAMFAVTGPLSFEERARRPTPCPLLRDDLCRVYAARPATCRTAVSRDVAVCERAFRLGSENEEIPTPTFYVEMRAGYSLALAGALRRAGFPATAYEYNGALNAVLGARRRRGRLAGGGRCLRRNCLRSLRRSVRPTGEPANIRRRLGGVDRRPPVH